jgi:signal transduction histidine kinase/CheY-like chemotaxis protein
LIPATTISIQFEQDVVLARQLARQLAAFLEFDAQDQTRIATAVSELARNIIQYAKRGKVELAVEKNPPQFLEVRVLDNGPGIPNLDDILEGQYRSRTGLGLGLLGAKKLMDDFHIQSSARGTRIRLRKMLPARLVPVSPKKIIEAVNRLAEASPENAYREVQRQNQELVAALAELQKRQEELTQLNRELEDTNRGVVALYAELDARADYLRRVSEVKSRFLSNMTHEFRTPLSSIRSLSELLLEGIDGDLNQEQRKQVDFILKAAADLGALVDDLLDIAKIDAGKQTVRISTFEMADVFNALRALFKPLLAHNQAVQLILEEPVKIGTLQTDESKVSQILRNLISNALKFTQRGEVRISAQPVGRDRVQISVTDTGIGIAPQDQSRIFEEFAQVENAQQRKTKGSGLGLPLAKKLAELLDGNIFVESRPREGSTFRVELPLRFGGSGSTAEGSSTPPAQAQGQPLLVIEDKLDLVFIYEKFLKNSGFRVVPAHTVEEAHEALKQFRPAAVLLDILLENENTWDLLKELKSNPETKTIPVFVVTLVDNRKKAMSLGADAFHLKPISRKWLLSHLEKLKS